MESETRPQDERLSVGAMHDAPGARVRRQAAVALAAAGTVLTATGIGLALTGGSIAWAWAGVSAQNPMRVVSEGLFAGLAAGALRWHRADRRAALALSLALAAFYASLAGASHPRRVGDGHEYIAMARQLSLGFPPSASPADLVARSEEMAALPGYDRVDLAEAALIGVEGRQDFRHFWLYPLLVSPVLAAAATLHLHWNVAFTAVNVALLAALAYVALLELPVGLVLVLAAGPILWWIDKAQIEIFNVAVGGLAFLLMRQHRGPSLLALGTLSAQNPAFLVVLLPAIAAALVTADAHLRRHVAGWAAGAVAVAASGPAYYTLRLGRPFPLADVMTEYWPSLTALLTPLVDPFCGFLWYCPSLLFAIALALPASARPWRQRDLALALWGFLSLLVVCAMTPNVNHGGTAGPSRYGLWLVPFAIPWLLRLGTMQGWRQAVVPLIGIASMAHAMWAFHPRAEERSTQPPAGAAWLMEHWPSLYDPLPEVFAERYGGVDGRATLPVASTACGKVLLAGDGRGRLAWPIPCLPSEAPAACTREGALCYASRLRGGGYSFSEPPRQPGFGWQLARDVTWREMRELAWLPAQPTWDRLERVAPFGRDSRVRGGRDLHRVRAFQFGRELLAFVDVRPGGSPAIAITADRPIEVWLVTRAARRARSVRVAPGEAWIDLPSTRGDVLVLVKPRG